LLLVAVLVLALVFALVVWVLQLARSHGSESPYWGLASVIPQLIGKVLTSTSKMRLARFWIHTNRKENVEGIDRVVEPFKGQKLTVQGRWRSDSMDIEVVVKRY
jgi:hypothetical protein